MVHNGVTHPADITTQRVRAYFADLSSRPKPLSDWYIHGHARATRTLLRFFYLEKYIPEPVTFRMPAIAKKRLLCPTAEEVEKLIQACDTPRDKALISTAVDTGARREELCKFNWGDVDLGSGLVRLRDGKGGKDRSVVVGIATRRRLLAYRREIHSEPHMPLFQTIDGHRLLPMGLRSVLDRISKRAGIKVTWHSLRRAFATLSRRAGMDPLEIQALLGHTTLLMTRKYIEMVDDDLIAAHQSHGPIDNLSRLRRR